MLDMGIVPAMTGYELTEMLDSLNPEDRRIVKRKFRKIWRKLAKKNPDIAHMLREEAGNSPEKHTLRNRSVFVVSDIIKNID